MSMIFLSLTLYTMTKSIIPMIIMIVSFIAGTLKPKVTLIISVILISIGILLSVIGTTEVSYIGLALVLTACLIAGIRMVFLQKILQHEDEAYPQLVTDEDFEIDQDEEFKAWEPHRVSTILIFFYLSILIGLTLLPFSIALEWKKLYDLFIVFKLKDQTILYSKTFFILRLLFIIFAGAFVACILNVTEYMVIQTTSSLTLSIIGVVKELLLIAFGVLFFKDKLNFVNSFGYVVCMIGILLYKIDRIKNMTLEKKEVMAKSLLRESESDIELEQESLIVYELEAQEKQKKEDSKKE